MKAIPIGQTFGRLMVLSNAGKDSRSKRRVNCVCACGNKHEADLYNLKSGAVKSCGCFLVDWCRATKRKHGHTIGRGSPKWSREYRTWQMMKARCLKPNSDNYKYYGGRGISVCERWLHSFENFLADMGRRPYGKSIDRWPDKNGNYEKSNCRWATRKQQANNQRGRGE